MLTAADVVSGVARMQAAIASIRDELNAADRAIGDGDTGMTVAQVVQSWSDAAIDREGVIDAALSTLAKATRRASGSSLAAVTAIGLCAAARNAAGRHSLDAAGLAQALAAAVRAISERSGAAPGDKTLLDSLAGLEHAFADAAPGTSLSITAVAAVQATLETFRDREAKAGRARMYGAQSAGRDDPGMLAALLLLRAVAHDRGK